MYATHWLYAALATSCAAVVTAIASTVSAVL
jgi:hypothetical protein